MKKIFLLLLPFLFIGCGNTTTGTQHIDSTDASYKSFAPKRMFNAYEKNFSWNQFDSICDADGLDKNMNNWYVQELFDVASNKNIKELLYIVKSDDEETVYRVQQVSDDSVKITKRVTR